MVNVVFSGLYNGVWAVWTHPSLPYYKQHGKLTNKYTKYEVANCCYLFRMRLWSLLIPGISRCPCTSSRLDRKHQTYIDWFTDGGWLMDLPRVVDWRIYQWWLIDGFTNGGWLMDLPRVVEWRIYRWWLIDWFTNGLIDGFTNDGWCGWVTDLPMVVAWLIYQWVDWWISQWWLIDEFGNLPMVVDWWVDWWCLIVGMILK